MKFEYEKYLEKVKEEAVLKEKARQAFLEKYRLSKLSARPVSRNLVPAHSEASAIPLSGNIASAGAGKRARRTRRKRRTTA